MVLDQILQNSLTTAPEPAADETESKEPSW